MGILANVLSGAHSAVLGDFKGAVGRADGVTVEQDPRDPEKKVLRFGPEKDDIFPVEGNAVAIEGAKKIFSKWIESPTQLQKIRDLPLQDRPILSMEYLGMTTAGYCNGDRIVMNTMFGTGYSAAGTLAHEFQHQYQFKKNENGLDGVKDGVNRPDSIFADRMMEAAADTAKAQYLYEIKDKNPQTRIAFYESALQASHIFKYAAAKDKGYPEEYCALQGMKAYANDIFIQAMYEKDYNADIDYKDGFVKYDLEQFSENMMDRKKKSAENLAKYFLDGEKLDEVKAFHAYTIGMGVERANAKQITRAMRSDSFDFITPVMASKLRKLADLYKQATGKEHENDPKNKTVRSLTGHIKNGKGSFLTKMAVKAQEMIEKASDAVKKAKYGIKSDHSVSTSFSFYDKGRKYISFDGTLGDPNTAKNRINFQSEFGRDRDNEALDLISEKEIKARAQKAQQMFSILMKDPMIKAQLKEFGGNGKQMTLAFDTHFKEPFTTSKNVIVLNPSKKPFELAADFAQQLQVVQQHEKAKELSGASSYAVYKKDADLNRDPVQMMQEKRLCQAVADTAKAAFIYRNQDQMGFFDKLKLKKDKVFQAFKKAAEKNPAQAMTTAIRESVSSFNVDGEAGTAKQTLKKYVKENRDNLNPEKINRLMSLKVPDEHLIKVACADQFSEKAEKKIHADTGSKPEYAFVSEKFASEMRSLKADRQKYAQMPPVQKESVTEKVNLQQKLKSVETVQAPSMMQKLQSQQNTNAQRSVQNVAVAKARMNGHQK